MRSMSRSHENARIAVGILTALGDGQDTAQLAREQITQLRREGTTDEQMMLGMIKVALDAMVLYTLASGDDRETVLRYLGEMYAE